MSALPVPIPVAPSDRGQQPPLRLAATGIRPLRVTEYGAVPDLVEALARLDGRHAPDADPRLFAAHGLAMSAGSTEAPDRADPMAATCDLTVLSDTAPRAAIIARRTRRRLPCRVGYLRGSTPALECLDIVHGGILTDRSPASRMAVLDELRHRLGAGDIDLLTINHLATDDPLFDALRSGRAIAARPGATIVEPHWRFDLAPGAFDATLARFSRKHRYNLRRARRQLEAAAGFVTVEVTADPSAVPAFLESAASVRALGYQGALGSGLGADAAEHALLHAAAATGRFLGTRLEAGDATIAYEAGVVLDGTFHLRSTAFAPAWASHSPGQLLLVATLEGLADRGIGAIDYGFGDAHYKRMYGNRSWTEATLRLFADTPRGRLVRRLHGAVHATDRGARTLLGRVGLDGTLRDAWRTRLARSAARRSAHGVAPGPAQASRDTTRSGDRP